jgi:diguanylate cyclase (GGDEF)-like protein/PAS domain S-box-containing protein
LWAATDETARINEQGQDLARLNATLNDAFKMRFYTAQRGGEVFLMRWPTPESSQPSLIYSLVRPMTIVQGTSAGRSRPKCLRRATQKSHRMDGAKNCDALWDWNLVTNRVHFSPRWTALLGAEDDEVSSSPQEWFLRVHPEDNARVSRELESARNGSARAFEFRHRMRHQNGSYRWMACSGVVIRDDAGQAIRLTGSHADVVADAAVDRLTGLPSRVLFVERLTRALDRYSRYGNLPFAVLLLGLDRSSGPTSAPNAGVDSPLLTAVARRLETCLRIRNEAISKSHDDLVARLEDDHFAILLEGLSEIADSHVVADRILADLQSPMTLGARQVYVSVSIGIAVSVTGYTSAEAALSDAETALYRARVLGGSRSEVFDTAVLRSEQTAVRLENDMTGALDREEFTVVYQPIVSLESYRIVGFEALVRWHHSTVGLIAPSEFIPIAERTGFIVPLGAWVLRQACTQLNAWREAIPAAADLSISVNLSTVQLKRSTVVDEIGAILRECNVNPQAVVLELTEGVACENPAAVKTVLMQLRALGIRISIDDFGTGYSSLAYLRQLPVDTLKVDRSFVLGMRTHDESAAIIGTVTRMARQLGLHVVAEGIEREDQVALLRSLHCESGQGYLFARPLDVDVATEILKTGVPPPRAVEIVTGSVDSVPLRPVRTAIFAVKRRWTAIAAAAAMVVAMAGVADKFGRDVPPPEKPLGPAPVQASATAPSSAKPAITSAPPSGRADGITAETAVSGGSTPPRTPQAAANHTAPRAPRVEDPKGKSWRVQHLHRFGSCAGLLGVSGKGLMFAPEEQSSKDALTLTHDEFLASTAGGTLTIKSNTKTYRFRVSTDARTADGGRPPLGELTAVIARFR